MPADATPTVVLLRSASGPDDAYVRAFEAAGFQARCVPVLTFRFPRQAALRDRLARPSRYAGLIATSPRAVRAIEQAGPDEPFWAHWTSKPAYAVGPKTAAALRALGVAPQGEDTGRAAALASMIAKTEKPYLFLCGNRRRDTLPAALQEAGTPYEELIVYETHPRAAIDLPDPDSGDWIVFFSPSGIEALAAASAEAVPAYRVAAIGPTTAAALRDHGWPPEAVAEAPAPSSLVAALQAA
ncbi:MAG: uroporphyrinogen-III synthase [Bacteroidetes bacterium]|jgi:uroporphyrinogen-III synthase|nr:uroporphyrinogen-III synthase [Bacteroidota bacterium]